MHKQAELDTTRDVFGEMVNTEDQYQNLNVMIEITSKLEKMINKQI